MAKKRPAKAKIKIKKIAKAEEPVSVWLPDTPGADLLDRVVGLVAKLADLPLAELRLTFPYAAATMHRGALTRGQAMTEILYDEFGEEFAKMGGENEVSSG